MSVVRLGKREEAAVSGGAMDKVVARRGLAPRTKLAIGGAVLLALAPAAYFAAPARNSQTVTAERLTISAVNRGTFEDFLPLRGRVTPSLTVFLDAVEGGRVERILVEDGAIVAEGQLLAVLSNSDLQLNVLARQTEVTQQINSMRSQELALSQTRLANERALIDAQLTAQTARRQYEVQAPLAERGFVPGRVIADSRDTYQAAQRRAEVLRRQQATDERLQSQQLAQLRSSASALNDSLGLARASLDALNLRAPVSGQLTSFSIQVGQSLQRGERLGQIDSAGRNKLVAQVDEFYLGRVAEGQTAIAEQGGRRYRLRVQKIYPQVQNGSFTVDLAFVDAEPRDLQRGQTVQLRLTLGDPSPALLLPNGAFYNETGGNWVFVVSPDGSTAVRRNVRLGRRNANFVEVLEGLDPGERVITSPYTGFAERDRLDLTQ
ncbi:efflux RND transporter periplasmic adaptor subunit [Sphingosinicella sp. YJ22]|uniref:efflux RND transporter periplasmic adaptor subunit n=1 Tax=Sphingosinicella sp. YJ22 TaxID=1104780 RepID=UPI001FAFE5A0|nr:efflux RND transporter periplasmic adaptor subunit [Sphingosinicella sp. YJ22]